MVFFKRAFSYLVVACSFLVNAQAQESSIISNRAFQSGAWEGSLNRNRPDGSFFSCSMTSSYKSGITLMFTMLDTSSWKLSFIHPNWKLVKGRDYPIQYWVDRSRVISGVTVAVNSSHTVLDLPANNVLFQLFRTGKVLTVDFSGQKFSFNLTGTATALAELFDCTKTYHGTQAGGGSRPNSHNPFSTEEARPEPEPEPEPPRQPPPSEPPQNSSRNSRNTISMEDRLEATRIIANMLARTEFQGYEIMSQQDMQAENASSWLKSAVVAWRAPNLLGTLHLFPDVGGDVDMVMATTLGNDAAICKGSFISGKEDAGEGSERSIFTICRMKDGTAFKSVYIFVPRQDGAVFRFTTITKLENKENSDDHSKKEDRKLRDALKNNPI